MIPQATKRPGAAQYQYGTVSGYYPAQTDGTDMSSMMTMMIGMIIPLMMMVMMMKMIMPMMSGLSGK